MTTCILTGATPLLAQRSRYGASHVLRRCPPRLRLFLQRHRQGDACPPPRHPPPSPCTPPSPADHSRLYPSGSRARTHITRTMARGSGTRPRRLLEQRNPTERSNANLQSQIPAARKDRGDEQPRVAEHLLSCIRAEGSCRDYVAIKMDGSSILRLL
ncbi:kinesin-related protein15 [Zea mays]|uniref:Kinesin-related protein15 n=1 Tax=Zea mays TaxID=4577 RepID=A0A1D6JB42_MAIZE|nr:kinesin-related protein15 [Zea mays]